MHKTSATTQNMVSGGDSSVGASGSRLLVNRKVANSRVQLPPALATRRGVLWKDT